MLVARTRWRAKILYPSVSLRLNFDRKVRFKVHLLAEGSDVPASLDDALAPVMVLVQLVAEVLEDGDGRTGRLGGLSLGFALHGDWLALPGSLSAHECE